MHPVNAGDPVTPAMAQEAVRIAKGIYDGNITTGQIDPALTKLVAQQLSKTVFEGWGKDLPQVDYGTPDYKVMANIEKNIYHFSSAKNYQQLKSMSEAVYNKDGSIKPWPQFKQDALNIAGVYNGQWLRTEYETAIAGNQMAAKWVEFEKNKKAMPNLQYRTAHDERVRESHAALDNVIRPVDDSFWEIYYPPNGWNCRCTVIQLAFGRPTDLDKITYPNDLPDMFKTNLGKRGLVFPPKHPYYIGVPDAILTKAEGLRNNVYSPAYTNDKTGGKVLVSNKADNEAIEYNFFHAKRLADNGETVKIRPHVFEPGIKNPELEVRTNQVADFKEPKSATSIKRNIDRVIQHNKQQLEIPVFVYNRENYIKREVIRGLNNVLAKGIKSSVTEVWLLINEKLVKITREDIVLKNYYDKLP